MEWGSPLPALPQRRPPPLPPHPLQLPRGETGGGGRRSGGHRAARGAGGAGAEPAGGESLGPAARAARQGTERGHKGG